MDKWRGWTNSTFLQTSKRLVRSSTLRCWAQGKAEMCALRVGDVSPYGPIMTEREHFRRTIVAPKVSFELLFPRVQTPRYVPDNVGMSIERSSLIPLL